MCPIVFASSLRLKDPLELVQSRDFIVIHIPSMMILRRGCGNARNLPRTILTHRPRAAHLPRRRRSAGRFRGKQRGGDRRGHDDDDDDDDGLSSIETLL